MAGSTDTSSSSGRDDKGRRERPRLAVNFDSRPPSFDKKIRGARRVLTVALVAAVGVLVALGYAPIEDYYSAPGRVLPGDYRELYAPPANAIVEESLVSENDHVTTGQLLMRLRLPELDRQIMETEIEIRNSEAQLALQKAREETTARMPLPGELRELNEQIAKTEAEMNFHATYLERLRKLKEAGASSEQEIAKEQLQYDTARIENERLKKKFEVVQQGYTEALLTEARREVSLISEKIAGAKRRLAFLQEERERLSELRAPADGVILLMNNDHPGEVLKPGQLLVYMSAGDSRIIKIYGGQRNIHMVRVGQKVRYKSDVYDPLDFDYAEGHIFKVMPIRARDEMETGAAAAKETYAIYASIDVEPQKLTLDSTVKAEVVLRQDRLVKILFGLDKIEKRKQLREHAPEQ